MSASRLEFLTAIRKMTQVTSISPVFLERLRRRDPDALAEAVRDHARPLLRAARALGIAEQEAEDLVQDVFTTFLERLDSFEGRSQLRTWLFGILHRKSLERRRTLNRIDRTDPIDEAFEARFDQDGNWSQPPADMERQLLSKEIGEMIRDCMGGLPANQREVFVLREVEGLDTAEICKIVDVSVTNLGVLMYRARVRLRECLETKGLGGRK